jgi:hypothetical protein
MRLEDLVELAEGTATVAGLGHGLEVAEEVHVDQMLRRGHSI